MQRPETRGIHGQPRSVRPCHASVKEIHGADEGRNLPADRAFIKPCGCIELQHLSARHYGDPVRKGQRFFLIVCHEHKGNADRALQLSEFKLHLFAQLLVERAQRLIQQQDFRPQDQRAGKGDALALTP